MTNEQFDALVTLMGQLAWRAAGDAVHQRRAGDADEDIEAAREICVDEIVDDYDDLQNCQAGLTGGNV